MRETSDDMESSFLGTAEEINKKISTTTTMTDSLYKEDYEVN